MLLQTKLYIPSGPPGLVARPQLVERLVRGLEQRLTLISAPAGFGKSSLVVSWYHAQSERPPVAWVSLDGGDNDPVRFWSHVIAALSRIFPEIGTGPSELLRSSPPAPPQAVLTALINALSQLPAVAVLVLDDYHVIENPAIHESITFLLEHAPPALRLVMTTRMDPPLPLARLRARGQLCELRAADLRFTDTEVRAFFDQVMNLHLSPEQAALLGARTEGWVAGLQLAGLSMQGLPDISGFIAAFAGSHRHVADYLVEEVLQRQDPDTLSFLVQTSVLDRMTGPLCDAVTGRENGAETLRRLERANLFVIPLDHERRWYRYHHLFQELLRQQLRQQGAGQIEAAHRRASRWFEAEGLPDEAVRHALSGREPERAAALAEQAAWSLVQERGEFSTLISWVQALPEPLVHSRPVLSTWYGAALIITGAFEAGEQRLADAEQAAHLLPDEQARAMADLAAVLRALSAFLQGNLTGAAELVRRARERVAADNRQARALITYTEAITHLMTGEADAAVPALTEAAALNEAAGSLHAARYAVCNLARVHLQRGELRRAAAVLQGVLSRSGDPSQRDFALAIMAEVTRVRGDLDTSEQQAHEALTLARRSGRLDPLFVAYQCLARVRMARGDRAGALDAADQAIRTVQQLRLPNYVRMLPGLRAQIHLCFGEVDEAARWANAYLQTIDVEYGYATDLGDLALARVQIATGQAGQALPLLQQVERKAAAAGRGGSVIEAVMLQAMAREALGDGAGAVAALRRALEMAEPEGYVRLFADEGPRLARLLGRVNTEYAARLLGAIGGATGAPAAPRAPAALIEPLTERELEVLRLLAAGRSNQEIARSLIVAEGTVKKHTHNIFGKLGVNTRTQALVRATELGILP